jgi:hypothetical protein
LSTALHKEALANAKELREIAENNAKKAIIDQITPTIKGMIERELLSEGVELDEGMDEDVIIDPKDKDKELQKKKQKEDKKETGMTYENAAPDDDVELTRESVEALAEIAGAKAEKYGVRALRIAEKLEKIHESNLSEVKYSEKLRQVKSELEKTYKSLQEDKKKNVMPKDTAKIIEGKLEELYEATNNLLVPSKVRLINESKNILAKKFRQFKIISESGLSKKAQRFFGKECVRLMKEAHVLNKALAELQEVAENNKVNQIAKQVNVIFKEIYKMANKHGALTEAELKVIIQGLPEIPEEMEGEIMADVSVGEDELEMPDEEMGDDLDDLEMGGDEEMEMEMEDVYESEIDEVLGVSRHAEKMGGRGRRPKKDLDGQKTGEHLGGAPWLEPEEGPGDTQRMSRSQAIGESEDDEVIEISEVALKQELMRLKKRRAAMAENKMKAMQWGNGPGSLDNFGGGDTKQELFVDEEDLNTLDPLGTGFTVKEGEDELDEVLGVSRHAAKMGGRGRRLKKSLSDEERKAQEKRGAELAAKEKESKEASLDEAVLNREMLESLRTYKVALNKLRGDLQESHEQLRETNLFNTKLVYANKLLQNENLSKKQRLTIIEALDEAESINEVKKLFAGLNEVLSGKGEQKKKLKEGVQSRQILGGSSRATKPGSTLTEGEQKEFSRWGELAGFLNE